MFTKTFKVLFLQIKIIKFTLVDKTLYINTLNKYYFNVFF